ncbi:MAG: restriction endonuclease, partial [Dehalococcoidales bacterium]|nr:restriction endonuclease [Dehalococcoidales bacterium]
IAVAIATADDGQAVGVGKVAQFDAEVFDTGIRNKVLVAIPQTTAEAKQLARQQRIRVLDEHELEGLIHSSAAA